MKQQNDMSKILFRTTKDSYGNQYCEHLLMQYFKYLEMADKISDRRSTANTFFLTVNTSLISAMGIATYVSAKGNFKGYAIVGITGMLLCYCWFRLIRSYKDLNTAKFKVVHELEKHLPAALFDAEWEMVGRGKNRKLYLPFTHIEQWIPWIYIVLYLGLIGFSGII